MLDKLTDNMKTFLMFAIYIVYLTWWAATLNTTVDQQILISNKTVQLLDAHIQECKTKEIEKVRKEYMLRIMQEDIAEIKEDIDGFKKGRDKIR